MNTNLDNISRCVSFIAVMVAIESEPVAESLENYSDYIAKRMWTLYERNTWGRGAR